MSTGTILRILSFIVGVASSIIGVVILGKPEDYGLTPVTAHWLGAIAAGLGVAGSALPGWVSGVTRLARNNDIGQRNHEP